MLVGHSLLALCSWPRAHALFFPCRACSHAPPCRGCPTQCRPVGLYRVLLPLVSVPLPCQCCAHHASVSGHFDCLLTEGDVQEGTASIYGATPSAMTTTTMRNNRLCSQAVHSRRHETRIALYRRRCHACNLASHCFPFSHGVPLT